MEFKFEKEKQNITRTRKHKCKKLSNIPIVRFLYIVFATIVKTQPYMGSTLTLDLYKKPRCCPDLFTILLTCNFLFVSAEVTRAFSCQCRNHEETARMWDACKVSIGKRCQHLTLFRLGFFGQSVTGGGGGSSDPPSVSLEPIMLGS